MARPRKQTVDYFPHDTDASDGRTLTIMSNKYGNDGYAFWFRLLELLGRAKGHYILVQSESDWEYLVAKTRVSDPETTRKYFDTLLMLGAIDSELYKSGVIWSDNFVFRLSDVYDKRQDPLPEKPSFRTVNPPSDGVSDTEIISAECDTKISDVSNAQSKVKETKVNNNKEDNLAKQFCVTEIQEIWKGALEVLRCETSKANYCTWFEKTRAHSYNDGLFVIEVPSNNTAEHLGRLRLSLIEKALLEVTGQHVAVGFHVYEPTEVT